MPDLRPPLVPIERPTSAGQKRKEWRGTVLYGGLLVLALVLVILPSIVLVWGGILFPGITGDASLPQPRHIVLTSTGLDAADVNRLFGQRLARSIQRGEGPPYRVSLSESELTGLLLTLVPEVLAQERLRLSSGQVAVTPGEVEGSLLLEAGPFRFPLRVRSVPVAQQGILHLEPDDVRLGRLPIPRRFFSGLLGLFVKYDLRDIRLALGRYQLVGVRAQSRSVEFSFE